MPNNIKLGFKRFPVITTVAFALASLATGQQTCGSGSTIRLVMGNCTIPGIAAHGIQFEIGDGIKTTLCGAVSTVTNSILFMTRELCEDVGLKNPVITRDQCYSRRGNPIDRNNFSTFNASTNEQITELITLNPSWVTLMALEGFQKPFSYGLKVPLHLNGRNITTLEGLVTQGQNHSLTHIGMGNESVLLTEMVHQGMIAGKAWGLNAGSQSYFSPREGSFVLGGRDDNSYEGNLIEFPLNSGERPVTRRKCPVQVAATDLIIRMTVNGTELAPLRYNDSTVTSGFCIESYDNLLRLGSTKVNDIVKAAGLKLVDREEHPGIYNPEEGLVFSSAIPFTMTMDITIEDKFTVTIPSHELVGPLRGLNREGKFAVAQEYTEIGIFRSDPLEDSAVLGKIFLSQVYLHVDWDRDIVALAKQKQRSDIAPALTPSVPCRNEGSGDPVDNESRIGFIVGMSVMGFVIALLVVVGFKLWRRYNDMHNNPDPAGEQLATIPAGHPIPPPGVHVVTVGGDI